VLAEARSADFEEITYRRSGGTSRCVRERCGLRFGPVPPRPQRRRHAFHLSGFIAIPPCDGDMRATVRALFVANKFLHARVERLESLCSSGYARGKLSLLDFP
jgi:hypothetical protein